MRIFKSKFLVKLIATICLFLTLFNFSGTTKVYAEDESWGGVLIKPVVHLLTAIVDGIMGFLNRNIEEQPTAFIKVEGNSNWWDKWGPKVIGIIVGVVLTAATVAVLIPTGGAAALGIGTTIKLAVSVLLSTGTAGYLIADVMDGAYFPDDIYLPVFRVSLDRIFSDDLALLDVNFFGIDKTYTREEKNEKEETVYQGNANGLDFMGQSGINIFVQEEGTSNILKVSKIFEKENDNYKYDNFIKLINIVNSDSKIISKEHKILENSNLYFKIVIDTDVNSYNNGTLEQIVTTTHTLNIYNENNEYLYSIIYINKYDSGTGLDVYNAIQDTVKVKATTKDIVTVESTAQLLRGTISGWYFVLRNFAMIGLMLILIYIGMRIVIGSTAGEKAKYKEKLMDWLVALCLTFIMHYIMVFSVEIVGKVTDLVGTVTNAYEREAIIKLTDSQYDDIISNKPELTSQIDNQYLYWNTDLMGLVKIWSQQEREGTEIWVAMSIGYVILVFYTIFFVWTYLKRVLYMAFLTMMAPLVAMTYPIDKINDGKAQAFNMWLKEYIFNLLIQPMHLLLYNVLIVSAYELAAKSTIYTLIAIGFMVPAEKLIRKFFGFEKAQTPGLLGGAAGAALAMTGIQNLVRHSAKGKGSERYTNKEEGNTNNIKQYSNKESVNPFATIAEKQEVARKEAEKQETKKQEAKLRMQGNQEKTEDKVNMGEKQEEAVARVNLKSEKEGVESNVNLSGKQEESGNIVNKIAKISNITRKEERKNNRARLARTISGVSGNYARQLGNKALKRVQNGRPIRKMMKMATGLYGGALLGLTGAALGIASGEPNKVLQYTSSGAVAGYGAGSGLANSVADTFSVDTNELKEEAEMSWYVEEYPNMKYNQNSEKEIKSEKNIKRIRTLTGWSRSETEEFLETTGTVCHKQGVTDVDDMLAINRVVEEKNPDKRISTIEEAIVATKIKNQLPQPIESMTKKKLNEHIETYTERFKPEIRKLNPNWNNEQINSQAEQNTKILMKDIRNLESAKSNLTQV